MGGEGGGGGGGGGGGVRGYALAEAYEQTRYGVIVNIFMQLGRAKRSQWGS